jgi:aspartyl-tRNA(Asn)/glutamyl-tRNA(Gln) amidotransferase subunit C
MPLNKQDVKKAADLARIAISDDEAEAALVPLEQVFTLIEQMQTQDTDGVEPMAHAQDISSRLREDTCYRNKQT